MQGHGIRSRYLLCYIHYTELTILYSDSKAFKMGCVIIKTLFSFTYRVISIESVY